MYDFEYARILKFINDPNGNSLLRLANPDLHDGQVLMDEKTKTVTVIDFGQALRISQSEIDFGLDIVSILSDVKKTNLNH